MCYSRVLKVMSPGDEQSNMEEESRKSVCYKRPKITTTHSFLGFHFFFMLCSSCAGLPPGPFLGFLMFQRKRKHEILKGTSLESQTSRSIFGLRRREEPPMHSVLFSMHEIVVPRRLYFLPVDLKHSFIE